MIFPYWTDAPLYHWPYATVATIALTIAAYFAQINLLVDTRPSPIDLNRIGALVEQMGGQMPTEEPESAPDPRRILQTWTLAIGDGIHPTQWITNLFLHQNLQHLFWNMIFLWCFGLIVEGKVGPWAFLGLYLGSGVLSGALIQIAFLKAEPSYALGASDAIFALLGICLIWAPANEFSVYYLFIYLFGLRVYTGVKEVAVFWFAILYFLLNLGGFLLSWMLQGRISLSSELAHLSGGLAGLALGTAMLKANLVDCEGWDLFSRARKSAGRTKAIWTGGAPQRRSDVPPPRARKKTVAPAGLSDEQKGADARKRVGKMLDQGIAGGALQAYQKAKSAIPGWGLDESEHLRLIKALHEEKAWADSVAVLRDYIERFPEKAPRVQLRLAQVLVRELERPTAARRLLDEVAVGQLPPDLAAVHRKLVAQADQMVEEGVLELEGDG